MYIEIPEGNKLVSATMKALVAVFVLMTVTAKSSFIRQSDLPHDRWVSLQRNVEFLPVVDESFEEQRQLRRLSRRSNNSPYSIHPFVEGESEYDEYQQAWRYLGFMIDCNDGGNDDDDGGGTGEGCHRYVVWAAYVDLDYEGGGIGEYQFWDRKKQRWDTTSCNGDQDNDGQSRCAKMDCHLEDTNWSLLGLFKHKSYGDWMEQLFKHEGFCVWSDEEYGFMKNARKTWPQGCSVSSTTTSNGSYIYYDLKPTSNGGMTFGLYTDTRCMEEYHGSFSLQDVLGNILLEGGSHDSNDNSNYDTGGYTLAQSLATWDSIFDTWKICHPCVAYDLNNVGYNTDDDASKGSAYGTYRYGYDDDYNYANYGVEHGNDFDCYDDAGYTNVNQCMKFMAKTEMFSATFRDLSLASTQGTLVKYIPVEGYTTERRQSSGKGSTWVTSIFFVLSVSVLAVGIFMAYKVRKGLKDVPQFISKEPLVFA